MEEIIAAPELTSAGPESPSTETVTEAQAPSQPQTSSPTQVENGNNVQATEAQRRKPSDYSREREKYRRLEASIQSQNQRMEEIANLLKQNQKPAVSELEKFDKDKFFTDPEAYFRALKQEMKAEADALRNEYAQVRQQNFQSQKQTQMREALEMLFPKSSPESQETLEQRIRKDPDYADRVQEILESPAFSKLSEIDPKEAAELARLKIEAFKPAQSPKAIPKQLMGSTARGNPGGGKMTVESKMAELKKLTAEVERNPKLRYDEKHKSQRDSLMREVESLMEEKRG